MNRPNEPATYLVGYYLPESAGGTHDFTLVGPLLHPFACLDDEALAGLVCMLQDCRKGRMPKRIFGFADDPKDLLAPRSTGTPTNVEALLDDMTERALWNAYCVGP